MSQIPIEPVFGVSDFVAVLNQTLEFAYPSVLIQGELSELRVSRGRWLYFKLKDESASVSFFGSVQQLPGPLEDGMLLQVRGMPRHHPLYGFTVNVQFMQPVGEGSIRRAADLLQAKLTAEGLFDPARKRDTPYPPNRIGLITSAQSAAYHDFMKILNERWGGIEVKLFDVLVQGEAAPVQIVSAIEFFNQHTNPPDVLVVTRGGGSADDLAAFSSERVVRAVAASRIPTLIAIGHEVDVSLAELAADTRASTPTNAASMLTPDRQDVLKMMSRNRNELGRDLKNLIKQRQIELAEQAELLTHLVKQNVHIATESVLLKRQLLELLNPQAALSRGYAVVRRGAEIIRQGSQLVPGQDISVKLSDAIIDAEVKRVTLQ